MDPGGGRDPGGARRIRRTTRTFAVGLALIATIAFAGRAAYLLGVARWEPRPEFGHARDGVSRSFDEFYYVQGAIALAKGNGLRFSPLVGAPATEQGVHPPLTSVLLTPAAWLTDGNETAMRFTVLVAGVGVVVLLGLIGRQLAGDRAGLVAAAIGAVYPNLWVDDAIILAETFATLFTAATVYFAYRIAKRPKATDAILLGLMSALAMLSRSELVLLLPLLVVPTILLVRAASWRRRLALAAIACLTAAIAITPAVVNDLARFDDPVFLSYGAGDVLQGANCADTYGGPWLGYWRGTCNTVKHRHGDASVVAAAERREGISYMTDHADQLPLVVAARVGRLWNVFRPGQMVRDNQYEGRPQWVSILGLVMFYPLVLLAIGGVATLWRRRAGWLGLVPVLAPIVIATLTAAAFYGLVRFRAPAEPSIVVLAAIAIDALIGRRAGSRTPTADAGVPGPPAT